ncbi:hypothetical protein ACFZAT_08500 [Streptomyces sp. NPDC008163]|uniref:hypothetical protein n=1 Tax=Streptomyces sp. NPDC008163 TaxID=3364818 RepID=UPI0036E87A1D
MRQVRVGAEHQLLSEARGHIRQGGRQIVLRLSDLTGCLNRLAEQRTLGQPHIVRVGEPLLYVLRDVLEVLVQHADIVEEVGYGHICGSGGEFGDVRIDSPGESSEGRRGHQAAVPAVGIATS